MTETERQTRALEAIAAGVALLVAYARHDHSARYAKELSDDFDLQRLLDETVHNIARDRGQSALDERKCGQSLAGVGIVTPCPLPAGHDGPCKPDAA